MCTNKNIGMAIFVFCMRVHDSSSQLDLIVNFYCNEVVCFITAYFMFMIISIMVIITAASQIQNIYLDIMNITYSILQNLSYLAIAFSNPGI